MCYQLRFASGQRRDGTYRNDFAVGKTEVVTGEDVPKEVCLQVIVGCRDETIVERLSSQLCLDGCSLFQCIIIFGKRISLLTGIVVDPSLFPLL